MPTACERLDLFVASSAASLSADRGVKSRDASMGMTVSATRSETTSEKATVMA